jgi:hypothetical protein
MANGILSTKLAANMFLLAAFPLRLYIRVFKLVSSSPLKNCIKMVIDWISNITDNAQAMNFKRCSLLNNNIARQKNIKNELANLA